MATKLNKEAFEYAKSLIEQGKFLNDEGHWSEHQPSSSKENTFIDQQSIEDYGKWHLGIDTQEGKEEKGRYKFPYGDFKKVHRDGLIAAKRRAAQNEYGDIEEAAGKLLELIEKAQARQ